MQGPGKMVRMGGRRRSVVEIWQSLWMLMDGSEGGRSGVSTQCAYS